MKIIEFHFLLVTCSNLIKRDKRKRKKQTKNKPTTKQNKQQKNANYCSDICYKIILVINLI